MELVLDGLANTASWNTARFVRGQTLSMPSATPRVQVGENATHLGLLTHCKQFFVPFLKLTHSPSLRRSKAAQLTHSLLQSSAGFSTATSR
jgi:hypothetical protein